QHQAVGGQLVSDGSRGSHGASVTSAWPADARIYAVAMAGGGQEDPRVLAARALQARDPDSDAGADPEGGAGGRAAIVAQLQRRTDRAAFEAARDLARSDSLPERVLGLEILGQLGYPEGRPFLADTLPEVLACCDDRRPAVLRSAII